MADEIRIKSESESGTHEPATVSRDENQSVSLNLTLVVSICATGMLICFFLPWVNLLLVRPSGFGMAKEGGGLLLWSIPFFCVFTILAGMRKENQRNIAQITGILPFVFLGIGIYENGQGLLNSLDLGGYASLLLGLGLIVLPRGLK